MIRNFKALGLAVVAMLAMSAFVASVAQAEAITTQKFKAQDGTYPESFHGTNTSGSEAFSTEAGNVECDSSFSGSAGEASTTIVAAASYSNCKAFGFLNATVNMNGCHYEFTLTTKTGADKYQAHVHIVCTTPGNEITITASTCEATVPAQSSLTTVDLEVMTGSKNDITVDPNVTGIKYNVTKDGFLCPFGGTGAKTGATYTSGSPVTITSANGIEIG